MSKNKYRSEKFEKRKKQIRVRKTIIWSIATFILLSGFIYLMNRESFKISIVEVSKLQYADGEKIRSEVENLILGKYLGLIPKSNIIFLSRENIQRSIRDKNIFVEDVNLSIEKFDKLKIDLSEYGAVAKWCGESFKKRNRECYLLNSNGSIFTKETFANKEDVPIFYGPISLEYIIGKSFLPADKFQNVIDFINKLKEIKIFVRSIETSDFETIAVQTTSGPYIMISTSNNSDVTIENLKIVIETEEINKAQFSNLEYIDLRFTNKAFYKIK